MRGRAPRLELTHAVPGVGELAMPANPIRGGDRCAALARHAHAGTQQPFALLERTGSERLCGRSIGVGDGGLRRVGVGPVMRERREVLVQALRDAGFRCAPPQGAYYVLADFSDFSQEDDHTFAHRLTREGGVATVPGSSFFRGDGNGKLGGQNLVRFVFCKKMETLNEAADRLRRFAGRGG